MTLQSLLQFKQFKLYSYGYNALRRWQSAFKNKEDDFEFHKIVIIEGYEMAIEQMLKHIISRSSFFSKEHVYSHNVWALSVDAEISSRDKYRRELKMLSDYYLDGRYEPDDLELYQSVLDYFADREVFNKLDNFLYELYTLAQDTDRLSSMGSGGGGRDVNNGKSSVKSMKLFEK